MKKGSKETGDSRFEEEINKIRIIYKEYYPYGKNASQTMEVTGTIYYTDFYVNSISGTPQQYAYSGIRFSEPTHVIMNDENIPISRAYIASASDSGILYGFGVYPYVIMAEDYDNSEGIHFYHPNSNTKYRPNLSWNDTSITVRGHFRKGGDRIWKDKVDEDYTFICTEIISH